VTSDDSEAGSGAADAENQSHRFDRLPETDDERRVEGRPTRAEVLDWWAERFGVPPERFEDHTFWERGSGKIWAFAGDAPTPIEIESLGLVFLRTRREHWKPTLEAVQRFGGHATRNVLDLSRQAAATFLAGDDQELDWDGDWGYLLVTNEIAGEREPLGVGLYVHGELRSQVPKGRRRDFRDTGGQEP
jgi:NOL1/NOP2/fmu family ribosome biogenesis protein